MAITFQKGYRQLATVEDSVRLGCDAKSGIAWLELTNHGYYIDGSSGDEVVTAFIGAVNQGGAWRCIRTNDLPGSATVTPLAVAQPACNSKKIADFQEAIIREWRRFDGGAAAHFAKGTTFGKSLTPASFVVKTLKTGFDAIGQPQAAYSGLKAGDWSIADLNRYAAKRKQAFNHRPPGVAALPGLADFLMLNPLPKYALQEEQAKPTSQLPANRIDPLRSAKEAGHSGRFAYAEELKNVDVPRIIGYGFRGDTRSPENLGRNFAGAFTPNYARPDQIRKYGASLAAAGGDTTQKGDSNSTSPRPRTLSQCERPLELKTYIGDQFLGGYISLTKSVMVAKAFACGLGGTTPRSEGWVYACFAEGAFDIPMVGDHDWALFNEWELAMPGMLDWADVAGWRKVGADGKFTGPVYLRRSLHREDRSSFNKLYKLFSGKRQ